MPTIQNSFLEKWVYAKFHKNLTLYYILLVFNCFSEAKKNPQFMVRKFGKQYVCVSKSIKPTQVYKDMVKLNIMENEKYKLIVPPRK